MARTKQLAGAGKVAAKIALTAPPSGNGEKAPLIGKAQRRVTKQSRAGIHISVAHCHKVIGNRVKGPISTEAAIIMASFLQFVAGRLLVDAAASAGPRRVSPSDVQVAIVKNAWLQESLLKGRVAGVAPIARKVIAPPLSSDSSDSSDDEEEDDEE